jgi:hypothetical protein
MRRDALSAWWKLALQASEVAWTAPFVIQQRYTRLLAPRANNASNRREAARMVTEKVEALQEAQYAMWQHAMMSQQKAWARLWTVGVGPAVTPAAAAARGLRDSALLARRALQPMRRRVKANAKRLRKRR